MNNPQPKEKEDRVASFCYPITSHVRLATPVFTGITNFFELLHNRRSNPKLDALKDGELDNLLWYSAKVAGTKVQPDGYVLSRRPSPSAGARHPLDLLIFSRARSSRLFYYNAFEHTLNELGFDDSLVGEFVNHVDQNITIGDSTLVWMIAHPDRTAAKYEHFESLVWRDAGALLQCIQMVGTALGLGSSPVGTLAMPYISQLFPDTKIISCGGIIIGNNLEM